MITDCQLDAAEAAYRAHYLDAGLLRHALRMALEAADKAAWQPMETAPRDGTRFWGRVDDDAIAMQWHADFDAFVSSWRRMTLHDGSTFADTGLNYQDHHPVAHNPTHWRQFPAPPESAP